MNKQNSLEYRFGFNGMEKDDEVNGSTGTSYTAEFWQYDSRLGRRWNVDPVDKANESSYLTYSGNPILMVDPNGDNAGDYYNQKGVKIGTDNNPDGRVYVVTDRKTQKNIKKNNGIVDDSNTPKDGTYFELPSYENRQEIKNIMGTLDKTEFREVGGRGIIGTDGSSVHLRAKDGHPVGPSESNASINLFKIHPDDYYSKADKIPADYNVDYTWHSHPNGSWTWDVNKEKWVLPSEYMKNNVSMTNVGGQQTKAFEQYPSSRDISNAKLRNVDKNYVMSRQNNKVYFYHTKTSSDNRYSGTFPLELFLNVKAK